jgi:type II secretory pathway pseudopilin PulG
MKRYASDGSRNAGFSLIEILVVLCGCAIIAAMALPGLTSMRDNYTTVFAAQEVSTQLHFAKLKAVSSNETLRVSFAGGSYQVEQSDGTRVRGPYALPIGISLNPGMSDTGVTFPGGYVTFQPDGTLPITGNGSAGRVKLISRSELCVDILVDRSGMIRKTPTYTGTSAPF